MVGRYKKYAPHDLATLAFSGLTVYIDRVSFVKFIHVKMLRSQRINTFHILKQKE